MSENVIANGKIERKGVQVRWWKRYQIAAKYTDLDEESSLHVAKECLISFRFEGRFTYYGNPWGVVEVVAAYTDWELMTKFGFGWNDILQHLNRFFICPFPQSGFSSAQTFLPQAQSRPSVRWNQNRTFTLPPTIPTTYPHTHLLNHI